MKINQNDIVIMKKPHVCGSYRWIVLRNGADVKIRCEKCGREVMIFKPDLVKRIKSIETSENNT
ncbi:MAG: DUF951 domain-containing protein [Acholeplasmataceae bacterium]